MANISDEAAESQKRIAAFALKDYELKLAYLTNHFQRMWTRFNYFVVIEAALIGGKTIFSGGEPGIAGLSFGAILSFIWYVMGAEDRFLVIVYRNQAIAAGQRWAKEERQDPKSYVAVGDVDTASIGVDMGLSGWRVERFSTTKLAALIPLAATVAWAFAIGRHLIRP